MAFDIDELMESIQKAEGIPSKYAFGKELNDLSAVDPKDVQKRAGFMGWDMDEIQNAAVDLADFNAGLGDKGAKEMASFLHDDTLFGEDENAANDAGQLLRLHVDDATNEWLSGKGGDRPNHSLISRDDLHPQDIQILSLASDGQMDTAYKLFRKRYPGADKGLFISFLYAANLPGV